MRNFIMNTSFPDISKDQTPTHPTALSWVGMQGIDLPLYIQQPHAPQSIACKIDLAVNLPNGHVKGIHMSRLYQHLQQLEQLSTSSIHQLLKNMVESHLDCDVTAAQFRCQFNLLVQHAALKTAHLSGWKAYPITLEATLQDDEFRLGYTLDISYSSTCPCSAALSRQLITAHFEQEFHHTENLSKPRIIDWLKDNTSLATPHSQRSIATISIQHDSPEQTFDPNFVITLAEQTLKTATQTAVKRQDEQAFAYLNGQNLMFVEDAARRLHLSLSEFFTQWSVRIEHQESLHPHNAVAYTESAKRPNQVTSK